VAAPVRVCHLKRVCLLARTYYCYRPTSSLISKADAAAKLVVLKGRLGGHRAPGQYLFPCFLPAMTTLTRPPLNITARTRLRDKSDSLNEKFSLRDPLSYEADGSTGCVAPRDCFSYAYVEVLYGVRPQYACPCMIYRCFESGCVFGLRTIFLT
jgi:hypothetical protein